MQNVDGIDIQRISVEGFRFTPLLDWVTFSKFSDCRFVPKARRCYPSSDGLSTTSNLLIGQSSIMVWLVGLVTLLGNISVLANRWHGKRGNRHEITKILNIFLNNLAAADFLMGLYLLILAMKDVQYRDMYNAKAYTWGTSWLCSFIGIIAMISSEVSLLILTIMSFERYFTISYGISVRLNLNANMARGCMLIIWVFVCTLALAPAIQWSGNSAFYGSTGLCFPLHLDDRYPVGWQYTSFVFIVVNSCWYEKKICHFQSIFTIDKKIIFFFLLVITVSYSLLYYTVRKTQQKTPVFMTNKKLASRFFLMVITDVLCWAPIITMKAIVLYGYVLPKEIIGWTVIYILPLNSAVNPILYTFSTDEAQNTIANNINRFLQAMRVNYRFISATPGTSMELQSVGNGCGGCANQQQGTATDDTELTHSSCPMMAENNCKNIIGTDNHPNKHGKTKKGKSHISICPHGSPTTKRTNFLTPHTHHQRHKNGIAVICPSDLN
ncbi:Relaxin receptor 1 [Orchesella cincta]|uniref:Relaxin receptor 1 n=1 Tax=Orchesella cincta TaxID=48709 RepID=A0A1D2MSX1_ORCCI|nr:Relaxin receptor 1 [Orchesella cincta]